VWPSEATPFVASGRRSHLEACLAVVAQTTKTPPATPQANHIILIRLAGESLGVIARKAGRTAIGSTITNNELNASRMYSCSLMVYREFTIANTHLPGKRKPEIEPCGCACFSDRV
jgi:hypothetical protein